MDNEEFGKIRRYLGKTQVQLARLLSVSPKAIQSFEQGWRSIPAYIERHLLFLLFLKKSSAESSQPCWLMRDCPAEIRKKCPALEFGAERLCWFINGTICQGEAHESWQKKMKLCRQCEVFRAMVPSLV